MRGAGDPATEPRLTRFLGPWGGIALSVGIIVGSGIFRVPAGVAGALGSWPLVALVWGLGGALALAGALTFAELVTMFPETGGLYVVLREAYGRLPAFLFGWTQLVAVKSAATAAVAVVACEYLARLLGLPAAVEKPMAVGLIVALSASSALSARYGTRIQAVATAGKVAALAALTLVGLLGPTASALAAAGAAAAAGATAAAGPAAATHAAGGTPLLFAVAAALEGVLWTYDGWSDVAPVAGEIRDPGRNLPRVLVGAALLVTVLYLAANLAFVRVLGVGGVAHAKLVAADVAAVALGPVGERLVSVMVVVSAAGTLNGSIVVGPRIYYAMAQDGLFFRVFARAGAGRGTPTPAPAIALQAGVAILLVLLGGFETLMGYFVFVIWASYAAVGAALFRLRRTRPEAPRPFRTPGYPLLPAAFVLAAAAYLVVTLSRGSTQALAGAAIVLAGVPVYRFWSRG